ncbi:TPA: hypothetical protein ACH7AF_001547, partial [Escherichia coli]
MPFPVPGVAENTERQLRDIANALPGETIDTGADSDYRIRANAVPALRASKGHGVNRGLKVIPALRASKGHRVNRVLKVI